MGSHTLAVGVQAYLMMLVKVPVVWQGDALMDFLDDDRLILREQTRLLVRTPAADAGAGSHGMRTAVTQWLYVVVIVLV